MNTSPYFEVKTKPVACGRKTKYTVLADGVEIGSRTTARPYKFARVVKRSQPAAIRSLREGIEYTRQQADLYDAVARRDFIPFQKHVREFGLASVERNIADGKYVAWAVEYRAQVERSLKRLAELESGPLPEFDLMFVASWHHARKNVPTTEAWNIHVEIIEIA